MTSNKLSLRPTGWATTVSRKPEILVYQSDECLLGEDTICTGEFGRAGHGDDDGDAHAGGGADDDDGLVGNDDDGGLVW